MADVEAQMKQSAHKHSTKDRDGDMAAYTSEAVSQPNGSQAFPFLKLPQELRDQIYQYILGGQFIHIMYEREYRKSMFGPEMPMSEGWDLCHSICCAEESENSVYMKFKAGKEEDLTWWCRHAECCKRPAESCRSARKLDLSLLRVCEQVHEESRLIPFTANTFSISNASVFDKLQTELLPDQVQYFRAFHLDVRLTIYKQALKWTQIFRYGHDKSRLLNLRTLHLCITQNYHERAKIRCFKGLGTEFWLAGFLWLQRCPLKHATVVMTYFEEYRAKGDGKAQKEELTNAEKQNYCEKLRGKLVGPWPLIRPTPTDPSVIRQEYPLF